MKKSEIRNALEKIRAKSPDGLLHPDEVVKAAAAKGHPLHKLFLWDNVNAAHQYRLFQARSLIRSVKLSDPSGALTPPAPHYVALKSDIGTGGGYRRTEDVVGDVDLTESLIETAKSELRGWIKRYRTLTALVGPIAAAAGLEEEIEAG